MATDTPRGATPDDVTRALNGDEYDVGWRPAATFTGLDPFTDDSDEVAEDLAAKVGRYVRQELGRITDPDPTDQVNAVADVLETLPADELVWLGAYWSRKWERFRHAEDVTYPMSGDLIDPQAFAVLARECFNTLLRRIP